MEEPEGSWYCVDCGVRLRPEHEFCWNCGARRWSGTEPAAPPPSSRPAAPPAPGAVPGLGGLKFFFAFWGVLLMVWATYYLARLISPSGREVLTQASGLSQDQAVAITAGMIAAAVAMAVLHAVAYHGISAFRVGGWVVGIVVAGLWSVILIGLPALYILLLRTTREAFGLA